MLISRMINIAIPSNVRTKMIKETFGVKKQDKVRRISGWILELISVLMGEDL